MAASAGALSNRKAALGALILFVAFIASRLLGLLREMVIAYVFGTSPALDAYIAAFRLPDLIFQLLASGAFGSAFIPVFVSYLSRGRTEEAWRIASSAVNLVAIVSTVLAALAALAAPILIPLLVPGFDPATQELAVGLTRTMLVTPITFGISIIVSAVLNARQHFLLPAIAPLAYNLAIIVGALVAGRTAGVHAIAAGVVLGSVLHLLVQLPALTRFGVGYWPRIDLSQPGLRQVGKLLLPRTIGLTAAQVNFLVYAFIASSLTPGSLAAVNWAWQLTMLPLGVFGMSIAQAVFPTLADHAALDNTTALRRTMSGSLRLVLFLLIPASVGLIILREPLVALLLERGQFGQTSTELTSWALMFFAMGLFAHGMVEILTRGFYALHDTRTPVILAVGSMLLNLVLSPLLVGVLAQGGLGLAMSVAITFEATMLLGILRGRLGGLDDGAVAAGMVKSFLSASAMGLVLSAVLAGVSINGGQAATRNPFAVLAVVALGGLVYLGVSWLLRSSELWLVLGYVRRAVGNRLVR